MGMGLEADVDADKLGRQVPTPTLRNAPKISHWTEIIAHMAILLPAN